MMQNNVLAGGPIRTEYQNADQAQRDTNKRRRANIINEISEAIFDLGINAVDANRVTVALVKDRIPYVKIEF